MGPTNPETGVRDVIQAFLRTCETTLQHYFIYEKY